MLLTGVVNSSPVQMAWIPGYMWCARSHCPNIRRKRCWENPAFSARHIKWSAGELFPSSVDGNSDTTKRENTVPKEKYLFIRSVQVFFRGRIWNSFIFLINTWGPRARPSYKATKFCVWQQYGFAIRHFAHFSRFTSASPAPRSVNPPPSLSIRCHLSFPSVSCLRFVPLELFALFSFPFQCFIKIVEILCAPFSNFDISICHAYRAMRWMCLLCPHRVHKWWCLLSSTPPSLRSFVCMHQKCYVCIWLVFFPFAGSTLQKQLIAIRM